MMKLMIVACLVALSWHSATAQTCTDVANCNSCSNPGPQCIDCPANSVLNAAKDGCLACGDNCMECTADENNNVQCTQCMASYYLDDSNTCTSCGDGCTACAMVESVLTCSECVEDGYAHNTGAAGQPCVECDSNCQSCSMADDLTSTICSKCYTFPGESQQGYFYKSSDAAADRTCKTCGSKASACTDDGTGSASITSCYSGYEVQTDNSRCLACPGTCASCNGEELGGSATCTSCVENSGVFLSNGECTSCTDNCDTCEDASNCADCNEKYRVDSGSCQECPAQCLECSLNADSGEDECQSCEENYGTKTGASITCDQCTLSKCATCTRSSSTGVHSCSACIDGYGLDENNECAVCGTGCKTCAWDAGESKLVCSACKTGYSSDVSSTDNTKCVACSEATSDGKCVTCSGNGDTPDCDGCDTGYHYGSTDTECKVDVANCLTYAADSGDCETCADTYLDGATCDECTDRNCQTCTPDVDTCTVCLPGFEVNDADNTCIDCGVSRCTACNVASGAPVDDQCTECESGYAIYDSTGAESTSQGGQCRKCATGCDACTYDYAGSTTTCSSCITGYTTAAAGTCEACPENCKACEYTDNTVVCQDGECDDRFQKNADSGQCDSCPDNCASCSWDADSSALICDSCDTGYGVISQGQCGACPSDCDECSVADSDAAPDLLTCDTCESGYAKNEGVCAACSSNCLSCSDKDGTMQCDSCKDGYALDSSTKECVSCFSNCDTCTSSNGVVKCTECNDRYSLAVDGLSCIICTEAAFENCNSCSDVVADTGKATCEACTTSFVLQDNNPEGPCVDVSSLTCDAMYQADLPPQCSTCDSGFTVTDEGLCAIDCYVCGDMDTLTPVAQSSCQIPADTNSTTEGFATVEECTTGICVAYWYPGDMILSGCARVGADNTMPTCPTDQQTEFCSNTDNASECEQCCEGTDRCNTFITTMDGQSAGIPTCTTNFLLLCGAALLAVIRNN